MEEMIKELNIAETLLGSLSVTFEAQDTVVAAKNKIRRVRDELMQMGKEQGDGQTD